MDINEFLPKDYRKGEILEKEIERIDEKIQEKISQEQFYDVITSKKPDWQQIIYDLINSEQLDPWDIDILVLTKKYFERIQELEEQDFYISSKVLLAAALLLRIKSEFLLNKYIKSIDEILFGKKDEKKNIFERIEINEEELPFLIPRTPLPRAKRVTLAELMNALNKAINTETRRIKKEVQLKRAKKLSEVDFPEFKRIDLKDRIKRIYAKIITAIKKSSNKSNENLNKICYTELAGKEREGRLSCFLPILHLSNNKKLWLEQEKHLEEIWIYLYEYFDKNRDKFLDGLEKDILFMKEELKNESLEDGSYDYDLEEVESKNLENFDEVNEIRSEINKKIEEIEEDKKIEKISGFSDENM
ncbi:MAG: segregation/condensation protein A [Candidatus Pacearchaeota archaeon]